MSLLDKLRRLRGDTPTANSSSCTIASCAPTDSADLVFGPARVCLHDANATPSGLPELCICLPLSRPLSVEALQATCEIGGLPAYVQAVTLSADKVMVRANLPDGMALQAVTPVVLRWVVPSGRLPSVRLQIQRMIWKR